MEADGQEAQDHRSEPAPQSRLPRPAHGKTPELHRTIQTSHQTNGHTNGNTNGNTNGHSHAAAVAHAPHLAPERSATPGSPIGNLTCFDWEDLEARFDKALVDANEKEQDLMDEFEKLVKYFNVWASAASSHDNERASKRCGTPRCVSWSLGQLWLTCSRLQTRTHFVKLKETDLASKRQHCESCDSDRLSPITDPRGSMQTSRWYRHSRMPWSC